MQQVRLQFFHQPLKAFGIFRVHGPCSFILRFQRESGKVRLRFLKVRIKHFPDLWLGKFDGIVKKVEIQLA